MKYSNNFFLNRFKFKFFDLILLFIFCLIFFNYELFFVKTDIQNHLNYIISINLNETSYPANFLFYLTVNLFSGFSKSINLLYLVGTVILSLTTVGKYAISKKILIDLIGWHKDNFQNNNIYIIALGLFFCFSIPDPYSIIVLKKLYIGRLVPMVWHNSTVIFVFPFSILLFWKQLRAFEFYNEISFKEILYISVLVILNIIIKPSFIFTYIPVTFFFLLNRISKSNVFVFLMHLTPIFTGIVFIIIQYYIIYFLEVDFFHSGKSDVGISSPFKVLSFYVPLWYIPFSFFLSLLLPISTILAYKAVFRYTPFLYSFFLTFVGVLISAFIIETGPRMTDGNFYWQNVICVFLLMLSSVAYLSSKFFHSKIISIKDYILLGTFLIHSISGFFYIIKIVLTRDYF
jgi:hypothetical protein